MQGGYVRQGVQFVELVLNGVINLALLNIRLLIFIENETEIARLRIILFCEDRLFDVLIMNLLNFFDIILDYFTAGAAWLST